MMTWIVLGVILIGIIIWGDIELSTSAGKKSNTERLVARLFRKKGK